MASNDQASETAFIENTQSRITVYEGRRNHVYLDSRDIPTVGIGFNLDRADAKSVLTAVGADYAAVRAGNADLTDPQVDKLFAADMQNAVKSARELISNFDSLTDARKFVVVDMAFNMGQHGLSEFKGTIAAIERGDFAAAADHMEQSAWYGQVGNRSVSDCAMMRSGEWTQTVAPDEHARLSDTLAPNTARVLENGSRGADVAIAQRQLGVRADGDFGPKTEEAVKSFQAGHGLTADGIIGEETRAALDRSHERENGLQTPEHHGNGPTPHLSSNAPTPHSNGHQKRSQVFEDIVKAVSGAEKFVANTAEVVVNDLKQSLPEITVVAEAGRRPQSHLEAFHDGKTHAVGADFSQTGKLHDLGKLVSQTSEVEGRLSVTMYPKDTLLAHVPESERAGLIDAIKQHKSVTIGGHADGSLTIVAHDTPSQSLNNGHARSVNQSRSVGGLAD